MPESTFNALKLPLYFEVAFVFMVPLWLFPVWMWNSNSTQRVTAASKAVIAWHEGVIISLCSRRLCLAPSTVVDRPAGSVVWVASCSVRFYYRDLTAVDQTDFPFGAALAVTLERE